MDDLLKHWPSNSVKKGFKNVDILFSLIFYNHLFGKILIRFVLNEFEFKLCKDVFVELAGNSKGIIKESIEIDDLVARIEPTPFNHIINTEAIQRG